MRTNIFKYKKRILFSTILVVIVLVLLNPNINILTTYEYINQDDIGDQLYEQTVNNFNNSAIFECSYKDLLLEDSTLTIKPEDDDVFGETQIKQGGEYIPNQCIPKFSTAIIIPFRNKVEQLRRFLVHMHRFLQNQDIHYRIFVVEQLNTGPFNRGKLINIGARAAIAAGFPCLVLHDVELLPIQTSNIYACTEQPRHMSTSINTFRFILPYVNLFGGVISITANQYKAVNGMSNQYQGWGSDEDMFLRLEAKNLKLCRFEPAISRYNMYERVEERKGWKASELLQSATERMSKDGLNTLEFVEISTILHRLFTHIMVDV